MGKLIAIVVVAAIVYMLTRGKKPSAKESNSPKEVESGSGNQAAQSASESEPAEYVAADKAAAKNPDQPVDHARSAEQLRKAINDLERTKEDDVNQNSERQSPNQLLDRFIAAVEAGRPEVCTYAWAYSQMVNPDYGKWSQGFTVKTLNLAKQSSKKQCEGLGMVRLDTFIVSKSSGKPSGGHWADVAYSEADWERVLGGAECLQASPDVKAVGKR